MGGLRVQKKGMSFRLLKPGKAAGRNLDLERVGDVEEMACICLGEGLPGRNIQRDEVVESGHNPPDQVLQQRHRMVPGDTGNIDAVLEQSGHHQDCA